MPWPDFGYAHGDARSLFAVGHVIQQQRELVAFGARHRVARPHQHAEPFRHFAQHLVANLVSKRTIDGAEMIDVGDEQREAAA